MFIFYNFLDYLNGKKWFPYFMITPLLWSIGNAAEEIYFSTLKVDRDNKKLLILYPFKVPINLKYSLCNLALFRVVVNKPMNFFDNLLLFFLKVLLTIFFVPIRLFTLFFKKVSSVSLREEYYFPRIGIKYLWELTGKKKTFSWKDLNTISWESELEKKVNIYLNQKVERECLEKMSIMGLDKSQPYICLHIRESGYKNDPERRPYRNADILNYVPAIKELINRGFWVVRIGDSTMKRLPNLKNVIDYPFTDFKSSAMDLYLIKKCHFYIGMQSGPLDVANMFQKPILAVDLYNWTFNFPIKKTDRGIIKHFYNKKEKRFLSVREILSHSWSLQNTEGYLDGIYDIFDNTPEELKEAVIEYLDDRDAVDSLQIEAKNLRVKNAKELFKTDDCKKGENIKDLYYTEQFRYGSRVESIKGLLCKGYLEKNWNINRSIQKITMESLKI